MLTIQILVKNNQNTIKKTLDSVSSLNSNIIIGDLGCEDETLNICKNYSNLEIIKIEKDKKFSDIRNSLSRELNFYINPWEVLSQGHEKLSKISKTSSVYVFQNDIINKETRIWTNEKFINPIYESIPGDFDHIPQIVISSKNAPDDRLEKLKLAQEWLDKRPTSLEACYYVACCYLSLRNYSKFLSYANQYLISEKKVNTSYIMIKYYTSQIKLHTNYIKEAAECAITCVSYCPFMAEFWCLLGDIYYRQKKYKKSKSLYENAIIIGNKRKNSDNFPIEIKKYKDYPKMMIENIEKIEKNTNFFG